MNEKKNHRSIPISAKSVFHCNMVINISPNRYVFLIIDKCRLGCICTFYCQDVPYLYCCCSVLLRGWLRHAEAGVMLAAGGGRGSLILSTGWLRPLSSSPRASAGLHSLRCRQTRSHRRPEAAPAWTLGLPHNGTMLELHEALLQTLSTFATLSNDDP